MQSTEADALEPTLLHRVAALEAELGLALRYQAAATEVLSVISSPRFELSVVFDRMVSMAESLCEADFGFVFRKGSGDEYNLVTAPRAPEAYTAYRSNHPVRAGDDSVLGRALTLGCVLHIPDVEADEAQKNVATHKFAEIRSSLAVPLISEGQAIGIIGVVRSYPNAFTDQQVALVRTFADQAVIAINNAILIKEVQNKSHELELASQHKSRFVANMSHELRTPLAAVLGYAELMREGIFGKLPEEAIGIIERIQANGKHLLGLINAVLDISKIEAGQFALQCVEYSVSSLIESVKSATESLAREKGLRFITEVTAGMPIGFADEPRLAQVLLNLVGNAIKFTDKGEVRMRADVSEDQFLIDVVDTGPGIPESELGRIFEEFHQIDSSSTKAKGGTGLGLTIARRVVELHGGELGVTSRIGVGSTFRLRLPIKTPQS